MGWPTLSCLVVSLCCGGLIIVVIFMFGGARSSKRKNTRPVPDSSQQPPRRQGQAGTREGGLWSRNRAPFILSRISNASVSTVLGSSSFCLSFYFIF